MLRRWSGSVTVPNDGRACLSNNAAERALRGFAVGRRHGSSRRRARRRHGDADHHGKAQQRRPRRPGLPMRSPASWGCRKAGSPNCCHGTGKYETTRRHSCSNAAVAGGLLISGIVHVLKSGGRWIDAPPDDGPRKTLYDRYVRWAAKGVRLDLIQALASAGGPPAQGLIDFSAVKAHRSASGGKGGSATRPSADRAAGAGRGSTHCPTATAGSSPSFSPEARSSIVRRDRLC